MSYKYITTKVSDNHYILPKTGEMKCDVHAFLNEHLFQMSEEACWSQARDGACYPGVTQVYLLPDCHSGYGVPIGSVIVTEDTIIQSSVGYDISCGIISVKYPGLSAENIASRDKREKFVKEVNDRISTSHKQANLVNAFTSKDLEEIFRYGAKAVDADASICEREYLPVNSDSNFKLVESAYNKAAGQLGSTGKGNHFIDLQCDKDTGEVWVMVHCGSRGYGYQTADYFFYKAAELRNLAKNKRELSWLRADEPLGKEYINHMNSAANYAIANRHIIVENINHVMKKMFKVDGEVFYEISHNFCQEETLVLPDGSTKKGFVHRKGSTRAFPAGHPDLIGSRWENTGHPMVVPGSMLSGGAILMPKIGAYTSGCSVNHGSGRKLARNAAKALLKEKQQFIDNKMNNITRKFGGIEIKGIVTNHSKTPLDESDPCYKDLDEVLSVLEAEGIAEIKHRLFPICNLKGQD